MRIRILCVAIVLASVLWPGPAGGGEEPLFGPPPAQVAPPLGPGVNDLQAGAGQEAGAGPATLPASPVPPSYLPDDPGYRTPTDLAPEPLPGLDLQQAPATENRTAPNPFFAEDLPEPPIPVLDDEPAAGYPPPPAGCGVCGDAGCGTATCGACSGCRPWRLFDTPGLRCRRIEIGGWIQQGITSSASNPADGYNGPVTFNDRDGEYQMNQFWLYVQRKADSGGCGWDVGGRIDFVYGTDARFTQAADGLEANWNQTQRFYQAALPQFYLDLAYNRWMLRAGHFYTIVGHEVVQAPDNFFYSHAYTMRYGEPFTHTGMLATYKLTDRLSLNAGLHRGWDQFDDTDGDDSLGFLGGAAWTSCDGRSSLAFALTSGEQGPGNNTVMYSIVGSRRLTGRLRYVIQHDWGQSTGGGRQQIGSAEWYGLNQYLLYKINPCWSAGLRFEWFRDDDGARVTGLGDGNLNTGPYVGSFYALSAGLNWRPRANLTFRPEVRWDWFDADTPGGLGPYDAGDRNRQFLVGCDLILTF